MTPIEDLQARDLAWISEFVMQQMSIMLHPVMDHMDQADEAAEYTQRTVERLSSDVASLRTDLERTNKYLSILRQGLGMQSEGRCVLQRNLENTSRTVSRLDDNVDAMLGVIRRTEENLGHLTSDLRSSGLKQAELTKQVTESTVSIEELQAKVNGATNDVHSIRDELRNSEETLQRDLRDLRRFQLAMTAPKQLVDEKTATSGPAPPGGARMSSSQSCRGEPWSQKKSFPASSVDMSRAGSCTTPDSREGSNGPKHINRVSSSSRRGLLQKDLKIAARSSSQAVLYDSVYNGGPTEADDRLFGNSAGPPSSASGMADETASTTSRLPLLTTKQSGAVATRPPRDEEYAHQYATGLRLRFSETLARQSSRGSLN